MHSEEIKAMLVPRGYQPYEGTLTYSIEDVRLTPSVHIISVSVVALSGHRCQQQTCAPTGFHILGTNDTLAVLDRVGMAHLINTELGAGQRHVWCKHCDLPLLCCRVIDHATFHSMPYSKTFRFEFEFAVDQSHSEFRSVAAGPQSALLRQCPQCGTVLASTSIKEVHDDERAA